MCWDTSTKISGISCFIPESVSLDFTNSWMILIKPMDRKAAVVTLLRRSVASSQNNIKVEDYSGQCLCLVHYISWHSSQKQQEFNDRVDVKRLDFAPATVKIVVPSICLSLIENTKCGKYNVFCIHCCVFNGFHFHALKKEKPAFESY